MAKDISNLVSQRGILKGQVTRLENCLNDIDSNTDLESLDLEERLKTHLSLWDKFNNIQNDIEQASKAAPDTLEVQEVERAQFEKRFYYVSGLAKKHLKRLQYTNLNSHIEPRSPQSSIEGLENNISNQTCSFQLPKLQTPSFNGSFDKWLSFYDSFKSMCHDNPNISNIQKFHYLKTCLRDEAAEVIASLETSSENYIVAWNLLKRRFNNKKFMVEGHVKALFEIPNISRDFTIQFLLDNIQKHLRALEVLEQPVKQWDTLLMYIIKQKLNNYTIEKWEEHVSSSEVPTMSDMISFLERRALIEHTHNSNKLSNSKKTPYFNKENNFRSNPRSSQVCMSATKVSKTISSCPLCSQKHSLAYCSKFQNLSTTERYNEVKRLSICHNCFYSNHRTIDCRKAPCKKCHNRHHSLLHFDKTSKSESNVDYSYPSTSKSESESLSEANKSTIVLSQKIEFQSHSQIILGTALVDILDRSGNYHTCRALLDSGSQCNAMTEKCATILGLNKQTLNIQLHGVENLKTNIKYTTSTLIKSRFNDTQHELTFLLFREISSPLPAIPIKTNDIFIPNDIILADPTFYQPADIDILLGAECFYNFLGSGKIQLKKPSVSLRETELGWIVVGSISNQLKSKRALKTSCNLIKYETLPLLWEIDGEHPSKKLLSNEEQECENHFINNTKRNKSGRYIVKLPFNEKQNFLGNSYNSAFQRFASLEKKFERNYELKNQYIDCMQGYIDQHHMFLESSKIDHNQGYYLPHHAVIKEQSLTTKTRVVFDGSAKTSTGISLNDSLMVGPNIQEELFSIVIRFRCFLYVLTADIQQMYRQILVDKKDRQFQRILWRKNPDEPIQTYTLNTVTFGTACAPFLAVRTLKQLASDESHLFPRASNVLQNDFYVDDLLSGAQNFEDALKLKNELIQLLKKGGFHLRKWGSNCQELISDMSETISNSHMVLDPTETIKTLGLSWNPSTDSLFYMINVARTNKSNTKRSILSQTSKLFDPLGLLGPVIIIAKILIQDIWKTKLEWDAPVPVEIQNKWLNFQNDITHLNKLKIPRCVTIPDTSEIQIHGFADASEKGYGACLYLRSSNTKGEHYTTLICSKSRVAPLKKITLPRLELCAATLLAHLFDTVIKSLRIQVSKVFFWSDSTIVINWVKTPPHILKTFVANRVAEIQAISQGHQWQHVPSNQNPADFISRGQNPTEFIGNKMWFYGPSWLNKNSELWPKQCVYTQDITEKRKSEVFVSLKISVSNVNLLEKYSQLEKLQRVLGYCFRFIYNSKQKNKTNRLSGVLSGTELNLAMNKIIKLTQEETFAREIRDLSQNKRVNNKSSLFKLNPFLDQGLIKVGGRLTHSDLCDSQKHPIILPKGHHITKLIIRSTHISRLHAGLNATLYGVREVYWPVDGRNATRHVLRNCITCFKVKPREFNYIMGSLPKERTSFTRPFTHTGIDYCGPFYIKEKPFRNRGKIKTFVAIFVCFSTKAVHLELASDLSTEAFMSVLKRFFARRGVSSSLHSDNATNFVGAKNEIKSIYEYIQRLENKDEIQNFLSNKRVTWHFIPPRAPHHGGLWEAAVKSFKTHFTRIAGNALLTYEQLSTYVVEIEAILNSRPISTISSDPNDILPLTPAHFLIGNSLTTLPEQDIRQVAGNRLSCWQHAQQMKQHFWNRWYREYLNEIISRNKWNKEGDQEIIKVGTVVVIKEDNLPPMMWKLGRITELHPGKDGIVRTVTVKNAHSVVKRSLKHVYPLPI